jgi:excisionase family DNA binding protein
MNREFIVSGNSLNHNTQKNKLMTRKEAATYLGIKEQTLALWAHAHRYDLPYYKIGSTAKYKLEDLDRFIERNQQSTVEVENA